MQMSNCTRFICQFCCGFSILQPKIHPFKHIVFFKVSIHFYWLFYEVLKIFETFFLYTFPFLEYFFLIFLLKSLQRFRFLFRYFQEY